MSAQLHWKNEAPLPVKTFVCGHCGMGIASQTGYVAEDPLSGRRAMIYICHRCHRPNFFDVDDRQMPHSEISTESGIRKKLANLP